MVSCARCSSAIRGCTSEMAKIFFSSNSNETCQYYREWAADHISSRYEKKILTGRSPFSAKRVEKVDFTSDWTSDCTMVDAMTKIFIGIVVCTHLMVFLKFC